MLFIAMGDAAGTCEAVIRREGPLSASRAAAIVVEHLGAHSGRPSGGGIKPANMLVDRQPPASQDLGFRAEQGRQSSLGLTGSGQFLGTLNYSAPEQIQGGPVDGRADEYSLACAAFELLSGRQPFPRGHAPRGPVGAPTVPDARPGLPPAADGVLAQALAKAAGFRAANAVLSASRHMTPVQVSSRRRITLLPKPPGLPTPPHRKTAFRPRPPSLRAQVAASSR